MASAFERDSQSKMVFHLYLYHHYSLMTLACPVCAFVCVSEWVMGRSSHSHWTRAIRNDSHEFSYFVDLVALRCEHTLAHEMRIAFQWPAKCKCTRAHTHTLLLSQRGQRYIGFPWATPMWNFLHGRHLYRTNGDHISQIDGRRICARQTRRNHTKLLTLPCT